MKNVTDRLYNPFDMDPPCATPCPGAADDRRAVLGFGDVNADFHVIGDHPGVHGGLRSGIPFGDPPADRVLDALIEVGLSERGAAEPHPTNCFLSLLHCCCVPEGETPSRSSYRELEPFFDAELRAITAHVLLPVGDRATAHVLDQYSARGHRIDVDMATLHATQVHGSGFLILPVRDPSDWTGTSAEELIETLEDLLASDYRQEADLGRFIATENSYLVR